MDKIMSVKTGDSHQIKKLITSNIQRQFKQKKTCQNSYFGTLKNTYFYQKRGFIFYLSAEFHQSKVKVRLANL